MSYRTPLTRENIEALRSEIDTLTEGFDLIAEHIVVTDTEGNILYANKAAEEHTGFPIHEMIGKTPGDLWGGRMQREFYDNMWRILKTSKRPFRGEVENRRKDGVTYWQELRIFPVLGDNGEIKFFIGMEPDITVRKVFEQHQRQYIEELERLNKYLEGREVKMKELTQELAELKQRLEIKQ